MLGTAIEAAEVLAASAALSANTWGRRGLDTPSARQGLSIASFIALPR